MKYRVTYRKNLLSITETFRYNKKIRAWVGNRGTTANYISALRYNPNQKNVQVERIPARFM